MLGRKVFSVITGAQFTWYLQSSPLSEQSELYCANMIRYGPAGARAGVVSEVLLTWAILLSSFLRDTRSKYCYSSISNRDPRQQCPPLQIVSSWSVIMVIISSEPPRVPPEISGVPVGGLTSGEWLRVSCHLPWMNVKPSLEFWVNDRRARHMVSADNIMHI